MSQRTESAHLGAYWGDRAEPVASCAERLATCIAGLAAVSDTASGWRSKGRSPSDGAPLGVDVGTLVEALLAGVNRRDIGGEPIPRLGYRWSAWNGRSAASMSMSVTCGAVAAERGVLNAFVLKFPDRDGGEAATSVYDGAEALLSEVVRAWEPEWALVTSHPIRTMLGAPANEPGVGWLTYLAPSRPIEALGRPLAGGRLFRVADRWEDVSDEDVRHLYDDLTAAGVMSRA
jgi:hypothetical protein